jgi:hypothetical protein
MNFIVVNGPDGWMIYDVESLHDSLRMFLAQYRGHDHRFAQEPEYVARSFGPNPLAAA